MYGILWILVNILSRIFLRYRTIGGENIPRKGGLILAANHASYVDIPLLGCGVQRRLWYLGRSSLFPNPIVNWLLRSLGWIPLRAERVDRKALGLANQLLKENKVVVIFPEGTRSPDGQLQPGKPGIGVIVAEAKCPVVPVYLSGTYEVLPPGASWIHLHPVDVRFGKPLDFSEAQTRFQGKEFYHHVSQIVMTRIAELGNVGQSADSSLSTTVIPPPTVSKPEDHQEPTAS